MVAPINSVNTTAGLNSLLRTQNTGSTTQAVANRNTGLNAAQKSSSLSARTPVNLKDITLASNKAPPTNLPRGSIVDKLV